MAWTWNPADKAASITLSGSDLVATGSTSGDQNVRGGTSMSSGKYYWEVVITTGATNLALGVCTGSQSLTGWLAVNGIAAYSQNTVWDYQSGSAYGATTTYTTGDRIGIAVDVGGELIWMTKNGTTWYGSSSAGDPAAGTNGQTFGALTGPYYPAANVLSGHVITLVPASSGWGYSPPSGFSELGTVAANYARPVFQRRTIRPFRQGF